MAAKRTLREVPVEASWAKEQIEKAIDQIDEGGYSAAGSFLDIARLHIEQAALAKGQSLWPRTSAAQRVSNELDSKRPKPL